MDGFNFFNPLPNEGQTGHHSVLVLSGGQVADPTLHSHHGTLPRGERCIVSFQYSMKLEHRLFATLLLMASPLMAITTTPTYTTFGALPSAHFGGSGIPNHSVAITTVSGVTLGLSAAQR